MSNYLTESPLRNTKDILSTQQSLYYKEVLHATSMAGNQAFIQTV